jgi:hypothetical protein
MSRFKALAQIYGVLMRRTETVDLNELEVTGRLWVEPDRGADPVEPQRLRQLLRKQMRSLSRFSPIAPQLGSAVLAAVFAAFLTADIARAVAAPIAAAMPPWRADLTDFLAQPAGWVLVFLVGLLTLAAWLLLPGYRMEAAAAGTVLTGLVIPAGFGLSWLATLAVFVLLNVILFVSALAAAASPVGKSASPVRLAAAARASTVRLCAGAIAGAAALAVGLARPWSTALLLAFATITGVALSTLDDSTAGSRRLAGAGRGMAMFAAPGAVSASLMILLPQLAIPVALGAMFLTTSVAFAFVSMRLATRRRVDYPLIAGSVLNGPVVAVVAIASGGADLLDAAVVLLVLVTATLLAAAPRLDANRRADRLLDGADIAAAAATVAVAVCLTRVIYRIAPHHWILLSALSVLVLAIGLRTMPAQWRRGPAVGLAVSLPPIGVVAGFHALLGGGHALSLSGKLWSGRAPDLSAAASPFGWQVPAALVLLAFAAAVALPLPLSHYLAAVAIVLAMLGTPAALGWAWWSPIVLGLAVSGCYSVAAVIAIHPRVGYSRLAVAIALGLHALLVSLVALWTTTVTLAILALTWLIVTLLNTAVKRLSEFDGLRARAHREVVAALAPTSSLALAVAAAFAADGADGAALTLPGISIAVSAFAALALFTAASRGRTQAARILGWLGGTVAAQLFLLSIGLNLGVPPRWAAFGFLALGTALITYIVLSNHLWSPGEATAVEFAAYASGVIAVALAWSPLSLAVVLFGGGCILSMDAIRMSRPQRHGRVLLYLAGGLAAIALWLLRFTLGSDQPVPPEALTLPLALLTFAVGLRRLRRQLELSSWFTIGPALVAAFAPTLVLVLVPAPAPIRLVALILGALAVLAWGRIARLRAPTRIGAAVALTAIPGALLAAGLTWLGPALAALALLAAGARWLLRRRLLRHS